MPTYDYLCDQCEHKLEAFQKITEAPLKVCPQCNKESLKRIPAGGIGLSFKGSGFYRTDYASKAEPSDSNISEQKNANTCCPCGKNTKCMV